MHPINSHHPPPSLIKLLAKFEQINRSIEESKKLTPISACQHYSPSAFVDFIFAIAVIAASGYLIHPFVTLVFSKTLEIIEPVTPRGGPVVYGLLGLVVLITSRALLAASRKCGQSGCRGRKKRFEFEIRTEILETEDRVRNSVKYGLKKALLELPVDYLNELEAELKKFAPANGRAVLVVRGRCGCGVVRLEVSKNRKMKK